MFLDLFKKVVNKLENSSTPLYYFILTFLFAATLRNFLEVFSAGLPIDFLSLLNVYLWYVTLALALILLFKIITKKEIKRIARVILPSFIVLIIAPLIDLMLSGGEYYHMSYFLPAHHSNLIGRFFTFFGRFEEMGVTPGMKLEIALVLIGSFLYFQLKKESWLRSLAGTIATYTTIFALGLPPLYVSKIMEKFGLEYTRSYSQLNQFQILLLFIVGLFVLYSINRDFFKAVVKDMRWWRIAHFELMFGLGMVVATNENFFELNSGNFFALFLIPISILLVILHCIVENNIADYKIDEVSNSERPLVRGSIAPEKYKKLSWIFLGGAILASGVVSFEALFLILLFAGNHFLYSVSPLRLKRVPVLSKVLISLDSLALMMLGFIITGVGIYNFPPLAIALVLISFTFPANFIDIKDYEGDKKAGIKTLPVLLGLKKAKLVIGLFFWLAYLSVYFISPILAIPGFFLGMTQFFLINREDYKEWLIFAVYLVSLVGLGLWLLR